MLSLIPESYLEPLQWFSEQMESMLVPDSEADAQVVQKGLILYRQGAVTQIKLEKDGILAVVQDVIRVNVRLDLNLPYLSECSCPAEGICRHQMAVFFQILSYNSSVSTWVDDWRKQLRKQTNTPVHEMDRARDLLKTTGHLKPDYQAWSEAFSESFDAIMRSKGDPRHYVISDLFSLYIRRLKSGAPFEQEWKNLYILIGYLVSFNKLLQLSIELEHDEDTVNRHYRHLFQDLLEDMEDLAAKLAVQSLPFAFDSFIEPLKEDTRSLLEVDSFIEFERIHLFRVLWTGLFKRKSWREEIKQHLTAITNKNLSIKVGLVHIHFLLREDEEALSLLHPYDESITPYFFYWLELLSLQKEWKRMEAYVVEFVSRIKAYLNWQHDFYTCREFMKLTSRTLAPFCNDSNRLDLYEKALSQMLPFSFHDYELYLFDQKEYEKWMELQTYVGFDLASISNDRIKLLQSVQPAMLLPLYHQAIQADIALKNRDHYRQAVRKLKKLRTLYKKMKHLDDWNTFLELLLTRTKRLRAFQEECKRGKLIDA